MRLEQDCSSQVNKCWICRRTFFSDEGRFPVIGPTGHHITPKQFKHRSRYVEEKEDICMDCHRQINKMFTNKELKKLGRDLINHPKVRSWIVWIRKE